jgi:chromosome segregation ATPase
MENAIDLEWLSTEFQFVKFGRRVGEFVWQHPHVEVVRLKSLILDLQKQLTGQNRELCQFTEANGRAERDLQLEGLREAIKEVAKKVPGLQQAVGEVRRQIEDVMIKLSESEETVERRAGPLERAALGLAETKDRMSRVCGQRRRTGARSLQTSGRRLPV